MLLPNLAPNRLEAGCDEVGRGCLCGPVTAAAVILPEDYANEWINDSKKLTKGNRERLNHEIKENALAWAIASATVEEIDEINILNASFLAMNRAKYASIAAASILAKTHRDKLMAKLALDYPGYGWEKNVGYPTKAHRLGIQTLGPCPHHRKSFRLFPK